MNKANFERHRRQLEELKTRTRSDATAVAEQTRASSGGKANGELSNAPQHIGDMGTEEFLHDLNAALVENEEYIANEVRAALVRLDSGDYGRCENCGRVIAEDRLDALPYARYCLDCADQLEAVPQADLNKGQPESGW
jgi:RNA polymerase-binding transcription factor DksA